MYSSIDLQLLFKNHSHDYVKIVHVSKLFLERECETMIKINWKKFNIGNFHFTKKKGFISVLVIGVAVAGIFYTTNQGKLEKPVQQASFTRTTILSKTTLDNSISVTGTVQSSQVSNVTTTLNYTVVSIPVQVGDDVEVGDVICVLNSEELEKSITKSKESLQENIDKAQATLDDTQENYTYLISVAETAYNNLVEKETALNNAKSSYQTAKDSIQSFQSTYDSATQVQQSAGLAMNEAQSAYDFATSAYVSKQSELASAQANNFDVTTLQSESVSLQATMDQAQAELEAKKTVYTQATDQVNASLTSLKNAQQASNYDSLATTYNAANAAYNQATTTWDQARTNRDSAAEKVTDAKATLSKAQTSDELQTLEEKREQCTLKAETAGKITAINVTVGSQCGTNSVATIQDTDSLLIKVTIPEYDVQNVTVGMNAKITSDATENEIVGTLTQISPVASASESSSGFLAEITVDSVDSGLLVGMNAKAEIVQSTLDNVYVVPLDAVGTNENQESIIYVRDTSSKEEQFNEVVVTTGEKNDYYIEISSNELKEGLEVRSSANPQEATSTESESNSQMPGMMGSGSGNMGSDMSGGNGGGRSSGGQGSMPGGMGN